MTNQKSHPSLPDHGLDPERVRASVEAGVRRYFEHRRARVPGFVDRHFRFEGAWAINRKGFGYDLVRAPVNTALVAASLAKDGAAAVLERSGRPQTAGRLKRTQLFLQTDVAREIDWLIFSQLLELPYREKGGEERISEDDALAREILSDPYLAARLQPMLVELAKAYGDPARRRWIDDTMHDYAEARAATAELASLTVTMLAGAILAQKLTPSLITLGPALAELLAQKIASSSVGFGTGLGAGLGLAGGGAVAHPSTALLIGSTGAAFAAAAAVTAVAGVVTDPVQRALGLHRRRLTTFIDTMEERLFENPDRRYRVVDAYVGRVLDLADLLHGVWRYT